MRKVLAVVGPICSGKTTYLNRFPDDRWHKIDIGDIVRRLTKTEARLHIKDLDEAISTELRLILLRDMTHKDVVISGIRQKSICSRLETYTALDDFMWVYLDVDQEVLEERYAVRAAEKDLSITFQQAIKRDVELGYNEMITYVLSRPNKCIIKNNVTNIPLQKS